MKDGLNRYIITGSAALCLQILLGRVTPNLYHISLVVLFTIWIDRLLDKDFRWIFRVCNSLAIAFIIMYSTGFFVGLVLKYLHK